MPAVAVFTRRSVLCATALLSFIAVASLLGLESQRRAQLLPAFAVREAVQPAVHTVPSEPCVGYQELSGVQFLDESVSRQLCRGSPAYILVGGKFPVCQLSAILSDPVLRGVTDAAVPLQLVNQATDRKVAIFGYHGRDIISSRIASHHEWESGLVNRLIRIAQAAGNDVTFLDVGSNIGVYSLSARDAGLTTVAVDANIRNLVRMHLSAGAMQWPADDSRLKLLWVYFSRRVGLRYLSFPSSECNIGGAGSGRSSGSAGVEWLEDTVPVMTATGDDLLPHLETKLVVAKIDIETSELIFLETGRRLFSERRVVAVQMEWWRHDAQRSASDTPNYDQLVKFFVDRNYALMSARTLRQLNPAKFFDWDTLWIRRDFLHLLRNI